MVIWPLNRHRCEDFPEAEKLFLAEFVREYRVIGDKGYDSGALARKNSGQHGQLFKDKFNAELQVKQRLNYAMSWFKHTFQFVPNICLVVVKLTQRLCNTIETFSSTNHWLR